MATVKNEVATQRGPTSYSSGMGHVTLIAFGRQVRHMSSTSHATRVAKRRLPGGDVCNRQGLDGFAPTVLNGICYVATLRS